MATDKTELRGLVAADLATALDAIALAKGLDRHSYVVSVLEENVKNVLHEASLIARVLRGNPLMPDADGSGREG
jgi:hypothetical protein